MLRVRILGEFGIKCVKGSRVCLGRAGFGFRASYRALHRKVWISGFLLRNRNRFRRVPVFLVWLVWLLQSIELSDGT